MFSLFCHTQGFQSGIVCISSATHCLHPHITFLQDSLADKLKCIFHYSIFGLDI